MSAKLIYKDIAPGAAEGAVVSSPDAQPFSNLAAIPFGVETPRIATLEHNMWTLDGTFEVGPRDVGLWSLQMSGEDCTFASSPSFIMQLDDQYTALGVFLRFATNTNDFCTEVEISWYRGGALLDAQTFYPTSTAYFCAHSVEAFDRVEVSLIKTSFPYRLARLEQALLGVVREFRADELGSVKILQQVDLLSSEIPTNTLEWKLFSRDNVEYIFQLKQPVEAYNGDNLIGVFYITGSKRLSEKQYEVICQDALGVLESTSFPGGIYANKNAIALLTEISPFALNASPSFSSTAISGYIPPGSCKDVFVHVCFAIGAICDTAGSIDINIYPAPTVVKEIPEDRIYIGGSVETDAIVTAVNITAHTYTQGAGVQGDEVIDVNGVKYVHKSTITTIRNPAVTATDKQNEINVTDATLVNPANVAAIAQRVYNYYSMRNTSNARIVVDAEKPGDFVSFPTPWRTMAMGNIDEMVLTLSNTTAADIKVRW